MQKQATLKTEQYVIIKETRTKIYVACCPDCHRYLSIFGKDRDGQLKCRNKGCDNITLYFKDMEWDELKGDG